MWVPKVMLGFANKLPPLRIVYRLFFSGSCRNLLFFIWSYQRLFILPHCRRSAELFNYRMLILACLVVQYFNESKSNINFFNVFNII